MEVCLPGIYVSLSQVTQKQRVACFFPLNPPVLFFSYFTCAFLKDVFLSFGLLFDKVAKQETRVKYETLSCCNQQYFTFILTFRPLLYFILFKDFVYSPLVASCGDIADGNSTPVYEHVR